VENPAVDGSSSVDEDNISSGDFKVALHLAPLDACVQMRPDLSHIDEETGDDPEVLPSPSLGESKSDSGAAGGKGAKPSAPGAAGTSSAGGAAQSTSVLPVFKRAETEKEEEMRRSSHAYWLEQLESEPWRKLQLHQEHEAITSEVRRDTFGL
jgi:DNA-directed RNA polymerase-3 subunit RPC5